jgi:hypothetical protein
MEKRPITTAGDVAERSEGLSNTYRASGKHACGIYYYTNRSPSATATESTAAAESGQGDD